MGTVAMGVNKLPDNVGYNITYIIRRLKIKLYRNHTIYYIVGFLYSFIFKSMYASHKYCFVSIVICSF